MSLLNCTIYLYGATTDCPNVNHIIFFWFDVPAPFIDPFIRKIDTSNIAARGSKIAIWIMIFCYRCKAEDSTKFF